MANRNLKTLQKFVNNYIYEKIKIDGARNHIRCNLQAKNCIVELKDENGLEFEYTIKTKRNIDNFITQILKVAPANFDFDIKTCKIKMRIEDK